MNRNMIAAVAVIAALAIAGIYLNVLKNQERAPSMTVDGPPASEDVMMNKGNPAPAFELMDVQGTTYSLADFKGQRVYVKFWASWCSICLAGMDEIDRLSAEDNGFKVITIVSPDFNGEQSRGDFIQWFKGIDKENLTVLLDEGGDVTRAYGVRAYPTSAYIGSDGILIKSLPGHNSNESIKETFKGIE